MDWNHESLGISKSAEYTHTHQNDALAERAIREDFCSMFVRLQRCKERVESLMPIVMGAFSLLDAQRTLLEAKYAIRITNIALVFVPLSFSTGLFSMLDRFRPGETQFWILWVVAVPIIAAMFAFLFATKRGLPRVHLSQGEVAFKKIARKR